MSGPIRRFTVCVVAFAAGALLPVLAFAQGEQPNSSSAPAGATTSKTTAGTNTAGTDTAGTDTSGTDTAGTNTAGTNTAGTDTTGTGADSQGDGDALQQWFAGFLALAILGGSLYWIDTTLLRRLRERGELEAPDPPAKLRLIERPVPKFLLVGEDGRWSTSKTMASSWTAALVWAITTLALSKLFRAGAGWDEFSKQKVSWEYLLLLGGPVAAAIGAKSLTLLRTQAGAEVKTDPPEGASFSQIYTDDRGRLDLIDIQYLAFNVLSIIVFVLVFVAEASAGLPQFPAILAALTAATAGAYLARKAAFRAVPVITSIAPPAAAPGEVVTLWGVNLTPPKELPNLANLSSEQREIVAKGASIDVFFDGVPSESVSQASEQSSDLSESYAVRVPAGAPVKDPVQVTVNARGKRGLKSAAYGEFKILGPTLVTVVPPLVASGGKVTLWGTKLISSGKNPTVYFDDFPAMKVTGRSGGDSSQDVLNVHAPELSAGPVKVQIVTADGRASNELDLEIAVDVRILEAPQVLVLGPDSPTLFVRGVGFITSAGPPLLAGVFLHGHPLLVEESNWDAGQVVAQLPTEPAELKLLGFADTDEAELVVRNDRGRRSNPWNLKVKVTAPPGPKKK